MQKNVPEVHARTGCATVHGVGRGVASARCRYALCNDRRTLLWFANQRAVEYHPTLVRADRPGRTRRTSCSTSTRPRATRSRMAVARGPAGPPGAGRRRAGRRGEDQRRQGRCTCSCRSTTGADRGRGRRHPGDRRAGRAARPGRSPPPRSSRRTAAARSSSTPPGPAARPWSPPTARGSGPACRCRSRWRGTTSTTSRPRDFTVHTALGAARRPRPVGRAACRRRRRCPPTWSRRATPSRSPGCRPCTRASAAPGRAGT